jgi:hypothetical protein
MSASEMLDAALDRADDAEIAAAARRFIHAHRWLIESDEAFDTCLIGMSTVRFELAAKAERAAFRALDELVPRVR